MPDESGRIPPVSFYSSPNRQHHYKRIGHAKYAIYLDGEYLGIVEREVTGLWYATSKWQQAYGAREEDRSFDTRREAAETLYSKDNE